MAHQHEGESRTVGVLGLGDLGSKLVGQLLFYGHQVVAYDHNREALRGRCLSAVDPKLDVRISTRGVTLLESAEEVLESARVVHWAVPATLAPELPPLRRGQVVVLHDSVMGSSAAAVARRVDVGQFCVAHCLMNEARRVLVSTDHGEVDVVIDHFARIGLCPKKTTVEDHDRMIARTQGVFALLLSLGLADELRGRFEEGDLTPSAIELQKAVAHRQSTWTKTTVESILANRELSRFVDDLRDVLVSRPAILLA